MKKFGSIIWKNSIYLLLVGIIGIFVFILMDLRKTVDHLSKDMVIKSQLRTNLELENFFSTVREDIIITAQEHAVQKYDHTDYHRLNAELRPLVKNKRQLSSIMMATSKGDEFMILDLDTSWMFRITTEGSKDSMPEQLFWQDTENNEPHYRSKKDQQYDPRTRPWYENAMAHDEMHVNWTDPYTFFTTKEPGITISTRFKDTIDDIDVVVAFDILLSDLSEFTTSLDISPNGVVFILTEDERVIGLPCKSGYETNEQIMADVLKPYKELNNDKINQTVDVWNSLDDKDSCFHFKSEGENWWGSVQHYNISDDDQLLVGVMVPESDFVGEVIHSEKVIIIGFILVMIFTVYILKQYRDKQKSNHQLQSQKEEIMQKNSMLESANEEITNAKHEIEEKSNEIFDSINYAKRIQTAILPPPSFWNKNLPESFVLYIPKDIVAGDFYWMDVIDNEVLFAAADCTGHGVPGAMVSVVCHNALNRVVHEFGMHQPAEILDEVTDLVIETFERADHEVKDGMDIALCGLTLDTMQLEFAGAHNPLWLIREGNAEYEGLELSMELEGKSLYEIKADKQPVGKFAHRTKFTYNKITVQKGDTIYLSSDGFPDQFGGDNGKKLKSKSFKKLLIELCKHDIKDQKEILEKAFYEWKGDFEQLDDVCVIGVKV
ncbi:SpoIIE family protein phosphatase [Paracrocinitomix mangrovi]|uniref:SpoIIE family protein phosphatase n=1 Tax=Paracrocinitomix mangrovi TaxID=2862509 RepID=UPI001C8E8E5F|nr:SpoIIE family protein phosphatase [Paracrocinitomix mangrovi]UKN01905.1 SpoIIE family protein phosphatase [Paracrocinitomix mangrovi]